jgi:hypothetical protein
MKITGIICPNPTHSYDAKATSDDSKDLIPRSEQDSHQPRPHGAEILVNNDDEACLPEYPPLKAL